VLVADTTVPVAPPSNVTVLRPGRRSKPVPSIVIRSAVTAKELPLENTTGGFAADILNIVTACGTTTSERDASGSLSVETDNAIRDSRHSNVIAGRRGQWRRIEL
jgi:hypothetical protein